MDLNQNHHRWQAAKYLLAYFVPLLPLIGLYLKGYWSFLTPVLLFGLLPALELIMPGTTSNMDDSTSKKALASRWYDVLLYLNLPILYTILAYYLYTVAYIPLAGYELVGLTLSVGIICGALGINVGHELGHRKNKYERLIAQGLLLGSLYMHFYIEHNRGHHRHVATPKDPATARAGETVYQFWPRSIWGGWRSAWRLEAHRLQQKGISPFSLHNLMLRFQLLQTALIVGLGVTLGWAAALAMVIVGLVGAIMLETVNYLEHYGLLRKELSPGRYEPVKPHHSWNSNHTLGRIMLYELTRHSDHHYRASRKYQVLRHHEESLELPTGYPGMMLLSLLPPIWFKVMENRLSLQTQM